MSPHNASPIRTTDVSFALSTVVPSPVGSLLLAATANGLLRLAFENEGFDSVTQHITYRLGINVSAVEVASLNMQRTHGDDAATGQALRHLAQAATELEEYFTQERHSFTVPLDFALTSGFREVVQQHLAAIPYGTTCSYQEIASQVGHPRASRAVGHACATNPLPIVLPCHRILRSDGTVGGYLGGVDAKMFLLHLEQSQ